jgi:hypothetical protein
MYHVKLSTDFVNILKNIQISVKHNYLLLSIMHVATCFHSKESSTGYYMNHNIDIYQMAVQIWDPKSLHKGEHLNLLQNIVQIY